MLRRDAARERSATSTKVFENRTALTRRITRYRKIQAIYMPIVPQILATATSASLSHSSPSAKVSVELAENLPLLLPSGVLRMDRDGGGGSNDEAASRQARREVTIASFAPDLVPGEIQLRRAQCSDAIEDLRTKLYMRSRFRQYKRLNVRNQHRNGRANDALGNIEFRLQRAADKYRAARDALLSLIGSRDWTPELAQQYPLLTHEDIRAFEADDPDTARKKKKMRKTKEKQIAEGSRKVSWIWRGADSTDNEGINAGMCPSSPGRRVLTKTRRIVPLGVRVE